MLSPIHNCYPHAFYRNCSCWCVLVPDAAEAFVGDGLADSCGIEVPDTATTRLSPFGMILICSPCKPPLLYSLDPFFPPTHNPVRFISVQGAITLVFSPRPHGQFYIIIIYILSRPHGQKYIDLNRLVVMRETTLLV